MKGNYKFKYAKIGAMVIGIPFLLWSAFVVLFVYFSKDTSLGSVVSFGVVFPSVVLGFPWGFLGIYAMEKLPVYIQESFFAIPINIIGCTLIAISPSINGAIVGYCLGRRKEKNECSVNET